MRRPLPKKRFEARFSREELLDMTSNVLRSCGVHQRSQAELMAGMANEVSKTENPTFVALKTPIKMDGTDAWNRAYTIVVAFLKEHKMTLTSGIMRTEAGRSRIPADKQVLEKKDSCSALGELAALGKTMKGREFGAKVGGFMEEARKKKERAAKSKSVRHPGHKGKEVKDKERKATLPQPMRTPIKEEKIKHEVKECRELVKPPRSVVSSSVVEFEEDVLVSDGFISDDGVGASPKKSGGDDADFISDDGVDVSPKKSGGDDADFISDDGVDVSPKKSSGDDADFISDDGVDVEVENLGGIDDSVDIISEVQGSDSKPIESEDLYMEISEIHSTPKPGIITDSSIVGQPSIRDSDFDESAYVDEAEDIVVESSVEGESSRMVIQMPESSALESIPEGDEDVDIVIDVDDNDIESILDST